MINLFLIRGLPSSGKSTLANRLAEDYIFEADQYFMVDGQYRFDHKKLPQAHEWCLSSARIALSRLDQDVVVSNTFTQRWEMEPYIKLWVGFLLTRRVVRLTVIDLFDGGCSDQELFDRNKHGVPLETFRTMRDRYEHDWRNANPLPPWER